MLYLVSLQSRRPVIRGFSYIMLYICLIALCALYIIELRRVNALVKTVNELGEAWMQFSKEYRRGEQYTISILSKHEIRIKALGLAVFGHNSTAKE